MRSLTKHYHPICSDHLTGLFWLNLQDNTLGRVSGAGAGAGAASTVAFNCRERCLVLVQRTLEERALTCCPLKLALQTSLSATVLRGRRMNEMTPCGNPTVPGNKCFDCNQQGFWGLFSLGELGTHSLPALGEAIPDLTGLQVVSCSSGAWPCPLCWRACRAGPSPVVVVSFFPTIVSTALCT